MTPNCGSSAASVRGLRSEAKADTEQAIEIPGASKGVKKSDI